jgi:SH3-like domain-containing protein
VRDTNAHFPKPASIFALFLLLASCAPETSTNSLGDAYVAPASLNLHSSLATKSSTVAVLKHGDHLTVVDVRRRYVKVRTDKGNEGWLDSRQLLSKEQMDELRANTAHELRLGSEGRATTFDALNMHIEPNRGSPAFAQIPGNVSVDVLAHKASPKTSSSVPPAPSFLKTPAAPPKRPRHQKAQKGLSLRPPMPAAPKPPVDWQTLSSERINGPTAADQAKAKVQEEMAKKKPEIQPHKPVVLEDWSLVRTKDQKVGWVLSRNLYMAIPDEVAQYAEGQRISSYFELGTVEDEKKGTKHHWLWTTSSEPQDFDFDRFRVFYWNRRRHRYETSYRQKDLIGYFPVEVEPAQAGETQRHFSIIVQDETGKYLKKRYVFDGTLVHLVSTDAYQPASESGPTKAAPLAVEKMEAHRPQPGWFQRQIEKLRHLLHR